MYNRLKTKIRELLPNRVWKILSYIKHPLNPIIFKLTLKKVQKNHKVALFNAKEKVKKGEKLKVAFFVVHEQVWKYEGVYRLMDKSPLFDPIIIIIPYTIYGEKVMMHDLNKAYNHFYENKYNVINSYDHKTKTWLDVKNTLCPDIVFFTNPYFLTKPDYYINNFNDTLTFYVPYGYMITNRPEMQYNQMLHNIVYKIFQESVFHQKQAKRYSRNKGINSTVTGYPGLDSYLFPQIIGSKDDIWKPMKKCVKKIIWAPHHTIERENNEFNYSNFLEYYNFFLELADKHQNDILISFKPHPILKSKLKKMPEWGEARTEEYYKEWINRYNCQLNEGNYIDLFNTSDAMIHDSGSFLVEYISTNKPSLYMIRHESILAGFSEIGNKIINCHYKSYSKEDIEVFINDVVILGNDKLRYKRETLIQKYLQPPFGNSASKNIINVIHEIIER